MKIFRISLVVLCLSLSAFAQALLNNPEAVRLSPEDQAKQTNTRLEYRPNLMTLNGIVRAVKANPNLSDTTKADADKLLADAANFQKAGNNGEARRKTLQAIALLRGQPWTEKEEYSNSLVLRPNLVVADMSTPNIVQLDQYYSIGYKPKGVLQIRLSLAEAAKSSALDVINGGGNTVANVGMYEIPVRDLTEDPFRVALKLDGVTEGSYLLTAEIFDGDSSLGRMVTPINLVKDMATRQTAIEQKLAKIKEHDSTKATIRYPFDLAKGLNNGQREVLGYDFAKEFARSEEILKGLEKGKDSLYRAKGDNKRNYYFTDADEIMPYRVYVPTTWDGKKQLPLIMALHGSNLDENNMLTRSNGAMAKLAEEKGYIVVTPLGYRINGGYGNRVGPTPAQQRIINLSEKDAMNVLDLVMTEYNPDRSRVYLMGNSMGGGGTFWLGAKYAEKFAAIAPSASALSNSDPNKTNFPFEKLKGMPVMVTVGDKDAGVLPNAKLAVKLMQDHGLTPIYNEVKDGTHGSAIEISMPKIFDFFAQHKK